MTTGFESLRIFENGFESATVGAEINLKPSWMGPNQQRLGSNRREWVWIGYGGSRNKIETVANGSESATTGFELSRMAPNQRWLGSNCREWVWIGDGRLLLATATIGSIGDGDGCLFSIGDSCLFNIGDGWDFVLGVGLGVVFFFFLTEGAVLFRSRKVKYNRGRGIYSELFSDEFFCRYCFHFVAKGFRLLSF